MMSAKKRILELIEHMDEVQLAQVVEVMEQLVVGNESTLAESKPVYRIEDISLNRSKLVKEMTVEELETVIFSMVRKAIEEFHADDPDEGLMLREDFLKELELARKEINQGDIVSMEELAQELGMEL